MTEIRHATFAGIELRVPDTSERIVEGIVVPWGETSFLTDDPRGERFRPGSLTRTIKERGHLVKLFRAHEYDHAIGKPVQWKATHEGGCWAQFRIAATAAGDEVLSEVREGMLDSFSVGFLPERETRGTDGAREIIEAQLHEVSLAPIGAYDGARVLAMRSASLTEASQRPLPPMPAFDLAPLVLPSRTARRLTSPEEARNLPRPRHRNRLLWPSSSPVNSGTRQDPRRRRNSHLLRPPGGLAIMHAYLKRLVDERLTLTELATRTADKAAAEDRELTDFETKSLADAETRCAQIDPQIRDYNAQLESARAFADLTSKLESTREPSTGLEARRPAGQVELTSWGQRFVESDAFRSYAGHGQSARYEIEGYLETRAAITTANLYIPHFVLPPVEYQTTAPLLEVVGRVTVSSGIVDWVEVGGDPMAAVVPEGTAKPEASFTVTPKSAALDTIAHWVQITRQALEDASYIRSLIESKLRRGLMNKAEFDMAAALVAATLPAATGADLSTAIRVGIGKVQAAGFNPNAVVLNPADYAALDVAGASVVNPASGAPYWGLRPVAAAAITAGTVYVGDFQAGATLFDRGVTNVFLSDSHASLFISNILVILAEARLKSAVTEPNAICECTATAGMAAARASTK